MPTARTLTGDSVAVYSTSASCRTTTRGTSNAASMTPAWPATSTTPSCSCSTPRSTPRGAVPSQWTDPTTALRSSTSTVAARSPGTGRDSWSATRSSRCRIPVDVVAYVRRMEQLLIDVCAEVGTGGRAGGRPQRGVDTAAPRTSGSQGRGHRRPGARGVTMHGFALNCDCDLSWFDRIVPCGIRDASVSRRCQPSCIGTCRWTRFCPSWNDTCRLCSLGSRQLYRRSLDSAYRAAGRRTYWRKEHCDGSPARGSQAAPPRGAQRRRRRSRRSRTWIKTRLRTGPEYTELKSLVKREGLHTVCEEAGCPNIYECWEDREATFLIGGDQCTRRCDFCQIDTGKPAALDIDEPRRVAESVQAMGLRYATVTGVARDDLPTAAPGSTPRPSGRSTRSTRAPASSCSSPTSTRRRRCSTRSSAPAPEVLAHNIETVPRIFKHIRPGFRYERSLDVIRQARAGRPRDEVQPHPRHGRGARRGDRRDAGPARRGLRPVDDHAVPAARRCATTR